jgi:membrane peptidoglycan carboxypeptidase
MGPDTVGPDLLETGAAGTRQYQRELGSPRRSRRHGAGGPGGPGGPGRPGGPRGPRGPRGRGRDKVKIKGSWWRHWTWRKALGVFLSVIGGLIIFLAIAVVYIYSKTPVPTEQMAAATTAQSVIYAKDGTVIGRLGTTDRQTLNYNQIPTQIIYSVLAAEDRGFFTEGGVSPTGIMRAAMSDLTSGGNSLQGGSTITQQFVRNYYQGIGTAQTATRKIKEIFVAMKIGRDKSKQWILENYLNTIYLGQSSYGVGAAAQTYFGIPVSKINKINWSQAALLAAVIQQPSTYPLPKYQPQLEARWQYVRDGLLKMGWITQAQYNKMKFPKFGDHIPQAYGNAVWDPYVVDVVQNELEGLYHLTQTQIFNGGYKIVTTIDPAKMSALYQSVIQQEAAMANGGESLQSYMHVGAVLENPNSGAIEAMYPGPGYPGSKYNGVGKVITPKLCNKIHCEVNMAVYNKEQVGSSFKPYILATAVAQNMNVQTSMLDGQDFVCIPPDTSKNTFPMPQGAGGSCPATGGWYAMSNDSAAENGAFNAQDAMTNSVNTAYADLWHYVGGPSVVHMASNFGVDTVGSGLQTMRDEAGVALGQASLTVGEQATMLAALDNGGVYHRIHIIGSISQGATQYPLMLKTGNVFSGISSVNSAMDSQVQYAMQKVAYSGTAAGVAGMSDGRQIISKTGTTNTAQSAFFIGAIPQEALAVGLFTDHQSGLANDPQTLNGLGGITQAFGGTWPAAIWHTYAQSMFINLTATQFPVPQFSGDTWKLAPPNLLNPKKPKHKHAKAHNPDPGNGAGAFPSPTATCPPGQITVACNSPVTGNGTANGTGAGATPTPGIGNGFNISTPTVTGSQAGAVAFGAVGGLPFAALWVRRRRKRTVR